jgi:hypothetical protein
VLHLRVTVIMLQSNGHSVTEHLSVTQSPLLRGDILVPVMLQWCYSGVTVVLHCFYTVVTLLLHLLLNCCYLVASHVDVDLDVRACRVGEIALRQLLAEVPLNLWC